MNLPANHRPLLRMALQLEQDYARLRQPQHCDDLVPAGRWDQVVRYQQRFALAIQHRHDAAAGEYRDRLVSAMQQLATDLRISADRLRDQGRRSAPPILRLLYEELAWLEAEFEDVQFDRHAGEITVRTERIVLEDIDLGPFEIRLSTSKLSGYRPYQVIALEPYPPASNDMVTHPHVQDNMLCEGEGHEAIAHALADGRIGEFFLLVAQILRTYNAESPYQSLAGWHGTPCADCDATVDEDERSECDRCGCCVCGECVRCCTACERYACSECSTSCDSCGHFVCDQCAAHCADCGNSLCDGCRREDLCSTCSENTLETEHDPSEALPADSPTVETAAPEAPAAEAADPLHAVCLGQAVIFT